MISDTQERAPEGNLTGHTHDLIAVVDDDLSFLRSVGRLLRSAGYAVATFGSARDFLSAIPSLSPGCLLLDVHMSGMTGIQLHDRLSAEGFRCPVIFITAYDSPQTREHIQRSGCAALLLKPFDKQALEETIRRVLFGQFDGASQWGREITRQ